MVNRLIKSDVTEIIKRMENANVVTFGFNTMEQFKIDGEDFFGKAFSCYNFEVVLDGKSVVLNPLCYGGDLEEIETGDIWMFFNFEKIIFYNNDDGFLGELTGVINI